MMDIIFCPKKGKHKLIPNAAGFSKLHQICIMKNAIVYILHSTI